MLYALETRTKVLSLHLTRKGAQDAMRRYWLTDHSGVTVAVTEIPISNMLYGIGSTILFIAIGVMLAWRG
jgi:hypothetical protein